MHGGDRLSSLPWGDPDRLEAVVRGLGDRIGTLSLALKGRHDGTFPTFDPVRTLLAEAAERTLLDELLALFLIAKSACGDVTPADLGRGARS